MRELSHLARPHGSHPSMIGQLSSPSHPSMRSRDVHVWPETVPTDWLRLRTIVDGLLQRAAAATDAADAGAVTSTTAQPREVTHG